MKMGDAFCTRYCLLICLLKKFASLSPIIALLLMG